MKHLLREYQDRKGIGECGRKGLKDREVTVKACEVTCPRCHETKAFAKAAKHPYFGLKDGKPKTERKARRSKELRPDAKDAGGKTEENPFWDDVLLGE